MNKQESDDITKRLKKLRSIDESLWRRSLQNKAWISSLMGALIPLIAKESGKSEKGIKLALLDSMKARYQQEMELIEQFDPALAAQLDTRSVEEL